jgi:perosamine synthetase
MPAVKFQPLLADAARFPRSLVPALQQPRPANWLGARAPIASAFLDRRSLFFRGSRYALLEAFCRCGVGPGVKVLVPALHCRTMVDPLVRLHADVVFYDVAKNLSPEVASLERECSGARAMVLTHYFGFPNDLSFASKFCSDRNIALIEDCAHAFYGEHEGVVLGETGRYATASAWKFLPCEDGAVLRDNTSIPGGSLRSPTLLEEVSGLVRFAGAAGRALRGRPAPVSAASKHIEAARRLDPQPRPSKTEDSVVERDVGVAGLGLSRWIVRSSRHSRVAALRRQNYARWLQGVTGVAGATPLFPELPPSVVPYAFPLLLDRAEPAFSAIKMAGVPLWRWEDSAETNCPVAVAYRERLIQFPLHQELRDSELTWMIAAVTDILRELA